MWERFDFTWSGFPQISGTQSFPIEGQDPVIGLAKELGLKPCIGVETWNPTYELPFTLPNAEWPMQLSEANWKFLDTDDVRYRIDRGIGSSIDSGLHEWIPSMGDNDFSGPSVVSEWYRKNRTHFWQFASWFFHRIKSKVVDRLETALMRLVRKHPVPRYASNETGTSLIPRTRNSSNWLVRVLDINKRGWGIYPTRSPMSTVEWPKHSKVARTSNDLKAFK